MKKILFLITLLMPIGLSACPECMETRVDAQIFCLTDKLKNMCPPETFDESSIDYYYTLGKLCGYCDSLAIIVNNKYGHSK